VDVAHALVAFRGFPEDARVLQLRDGSKEPATSHGHHDAAPIADFYELGRNVGIALDGQYLVVDIDRDCPESRDLQARLNTLGTWSQKTPKGRHFLFYFSDGFRTENGPKNGKLRDKNGVPYGDIKALGYIVGPGSEVGGKVYQRENDADPIEAPAWVVDTAKAAFRYTAPTGTSPVGDRTGVPAGEHDDFLVSVAGFLRGRHGLGAEAIQRVLFGAVEALEGVDTSRPYRESDLARIARSVARKPAEIDSTVSSLLPTSWLRGSDVSIVGPPVRWWVRNFFPRGELVMLYGSGGIGKSSAGSWLASEVTNAGGTFAFVGVEEPFARFLGRAVLAGARRENIFGIPDPSALLLPRDADRLAEGIAQSGLGCLYIDSVYSHFEHFEGLNAAERSRRALAPLAEIAQRTGCTVVCVFHTNKGGEFLGSVEMVNVARHVLKASRSGDKPLRLDVKKTNLRMPDIALALVGEEMPLRDPATNEMQYEELDDGSIQEMTIVVPHRGDDIPVNAIDLEDVKEQKQE
jgi:AAA domain/Bifunctional DNA primase/polymerase, N-terminal